MEPIPEPNNAHESADEPTIPSWRVLLAAALWARENGDSVRNQLAFCPGAGIELAEQRSADPAAWLQWRPQSGWSMGTGIPAAARVVFDLYLPLCAASQRRPLTIGHLGQSLDGYIATGSGDSYYVTGPANVRHLHRLRALCDAVIVGAETVARDDPKLTVRHVEGANPVRVVLDPGGRLGADRRVLSDAAAHTLLVCEQGVSKPSAAAAASGAVELLRVPAEKGRFRLDALLDALHARGLHSVFVEGGGSTVSAFLEAGLLDRLQVAIAPLLTGRGRPGIRLQARDTIAECLRPAHRIFAMGGDVLFDCDLRAAAAREPSVTASRGDLRRVL